MKFFLARKSQLNLERFIKESELLYNDSDIIKKINKKKIEEENKNKQAYPPQESKYNFLQIVKNYNLNRIGRQNGFTKQYISLLTDLLYKNDHENYSSKRLSLVDYRKEILKKNISISFEDFIERITFPEKFEDNLYLTNINRKLYNLKHKNKYKYKYPFNYLKMMNKTQKTRNIKYLSSTNFFKNINYKFNLNNNLSSRNLKMKSVSETNIPIDFTKISKPNKLKTITAYTYKNKKEENKYMWQLTPEDELKQLNINTKFFHYLDNQYHFFKDTKSKDKKNIKDINKIKILFSKNRIKLDKKVEFPYKKEFFNRLNRLKLKRFKQNSI